MSTPFRSYLRPVAGVAVVVVGLALACTPKYDGLGGRHGLPRAHSVRDEQRGDHYDRRLYDDHFDPNWTHDRAQLKLQGQARALHPASRVMQE